MASITTLRMGAATSAHDTGISDANIQMLGCWKSDKLYIRTPREELAKFSGRLVAGSVSMKKK